MTNEEYQKEQTRINVEYETMRDANWLVINEHKAKVADLKRNIDLHNNEIRKLLSENSALRTKFKQDMEALTDRYRQGDDYKANHARRDGFKLQRKLQAKMKELLGDLGDQLNVDELKVEWQYDEEEDAYTFDVIIPKTTADD